MRSKSHCCLMTVACIAPMILLAGQTERSAPIRGVTEKVFESSSEAPKIDKSEYHLFRPVPRELMRDMSTDRPDQTESPYTVDAGHFQLESDVLKFSRDKESHIRNFSVMTTNFKMGLTNSIDVQFVFEPYNYSKSKDRDEDGIRSTETAEGFGDVTTRLKINLWGNDKGKTAFAAMPFIKIPTNQNDLGNNYAEGGVIFPFGTELPLGWNLGAMTEFDLIRDEDNEGYHIEFVNSLTVSHEIVGDLSGYLEFYSVVSTDSGSRWIGNVDVGLTYGLTENIQLDAGVNIGVTKSADDFNPFIGLSMRF